MTFFVMKLPCGSRAYFDHESNCSHRCERCNATVGSVGMPGACKDAMDKYEICKKLGSGVRWNYETGKEVDISH